MRDYGLARSISTPGDTHRLTHEKSEANLIPPKDQNVPQNDRKSGNNALSRSLAPLPRRWRSPHGCCGVLLDGVFVFSGVRSLAAAVVHVVLLFAELLSSGTAAATTAAVQFRLSEPSVLGLPALQSRLLWDFENVPNAMLFFVRQGPPGLPAVSRFLSNLYQLISLNACHLSATSRCSTVEYSTRRIRRCATRLPWSSWASTRAI